ncbi:MAG: diguanylate cyclase [Campylobacterota bacterium]|nr:diguanylate cyclase [Campylobacterota bacterium]
MNLVKTLFGTVSKVSDALSFQLFLHSPAPTVVTDEQSVIVMANAAFSDLTGYDASELTGEKMSLLKSGRHDYMFYTELWEKLTSEGSYEGEIWSRCKDHSELLLMEKIKRIEHNNQTFYLGLVEDITESRRLNERYQHLATHDALTGLANRTLAKDRFLHATLNSLRAGEKVGVMLCDLNEFKPVNDEYGHAVGDRALIEATKQFETFVRQGDTVARFGGDEFLIIVERLKDEQELSKLAAKLQEEFLVSLEADEKMIEIKVSIGTACFPNEGTTYEQLLKIADMNMYRQKKQYYGH